MRHGKKVNHLSRKKGHRRALLANMASSLIEHKRIQTTVAKAKALRVYIEPLVTRAKDNSTHNRRIVFSALQNKRAVSELFDVVGPQVASRPGGYVRIIKLGHRLGDNADMALIELVDFNDTYVVEKKAKSGTTKKRRSRRGGGKKKQSAATEVTEEVAETTAEVETAVAEVAETVEETTQEAVVDAVEESAAEVKEEVQEAVAEVKEEVEETVTEATDAVEETQTDAESSDEENSSEEENTEDKA